MESFEEFERKIDRIRRNRGYIKLRRTKGKTGVVFSDDEKNNFEELYLIWDKTGKKWVRQDMNGNISHLQCSTIRQELEFLQKKEQGFEIV
jgi:hypothetical protein